MPAWRNATAALSVMPRMAERAASGDFRRVRRAAVMVMHARCCYPSLAKVIISEYYLVLIPSANHPFCLPCAQLQDRQNPRAVHSDPCIAASNMPVAGSIDRPHQGRTAHARCLLLFQINQSPHGLSRCLFVPNLGEKQGTGRQFIGREASKQRALDWIEMP